MRSVASFTNNIGMRVVLDMANEWISLILPFKFWPVKGETDLNWLPEYFDIQTGVLFKMFRDHDLILKI